MSGREISSPWLALMMMVKQASQRAQVFAQKLKKFREISLYFSG